MARARQKRGGPPGPGDHLGRYRIEGWIARRADSAVWRGRALDGGGAVAIKWVSARRHRRSRERVELQRRVSASHPNLPEIVASVEDERGLFAVMELGKGPTLSQRLAQGEGPLSVERVSRLLADMAAALSTIHGVGMVHRDLKPGNILLPDDGPAMLCDFGLVAPVGTAGPAEVGTVRYMAPEVLRGDPADGRADLYSLGMVAYEALAGRDGFFQAFREILDRDDDRAWLQWHTAGGPPPPVGRFHAAVPAHLATLVHAMLSKTPEGRPRTADAVRARADPMRKEADMAEPRRASQRGGIVQRVGDGEGAAVDVSDPNLVTDDQPTSAIPTLRRWPVWLAALAVVQLVGFATYFGVELWQHRQAEAARVSTARELFGRARSAYQQGTVGPAREVFATLSDRWPEHPRLGVGGRAYAALCEARRSLSTGRRRMADKRYEAAAKAYATAEEKLGVARAAASGPLEETIRTEVRALRKQVRKRKTFLEHARAVAKQIDDGNYQRAKERWRSAMEALTGERRLARQERQILDQLYDRIVSEQTNRRIEAITERARERLREGRAEEAVEILKQGQTSHPSSRRIRQLLRRARRRIEYRRAVTLAKEATHRGKLKRAIKYYSQAREIQTGKWVRQRIQSLRARVAYRKGKKLQERGELEAAHEQYRRSLAFQPTSRAKKALASLEVETDRAELLALAERALRRRNYTAAIEHYKRALEMKASEKIAKKLKQARLRKQNQEAQKLLRQGNLEEARGAIRKALEIDSSNQRALKLHAEYELRKKYREILKKGDALLRSGSFKQAKAKYREALKLIRETNVSPQLVEERLANADYQRHLTEAKKARESGRWQEAIEALEKARSIRDTPTVRRLLKAVRSAAG